MCCGRAVSRSVGWSIGPVPCCNAIFIHPIRVCIVIVMVTVVILFCLVLLCFVLQECVLKLLGGCWCRAYLTSVPNAFLYKNSAVTFL